MKRALVCLIASLFATHAVARPMSRAIAVNDSRTITVETDGRQEKITLRGFEIDAGDERDAAAYLAGLIRESWLYVENGDVYRSPDGLYVNGEMARHAWLTTPGMKYLGPLDLAPQTKKPPAPKISAPTLPVPVFAYAGNLAVRYLRLYITKGHEVAGSPLTPADTDPLDYLKQAKWLEAEDLFYLGFHFVEGAGVDRTFGGQVLHLLLKRSPKSKLAKDAKRKLRSQGLD